MIRSYEFQLSAPQPFLTAYPLYAAMLERGSPYFAAQLHNSTITPVSQYVSGNCWKVSLFGADTIHALSPVLEQMDAVYIRKTQTQLQLQLQACHSIESVDELLEQPSRRRGILHFRTPVAFKSGGAYQLLPTQRLIMQNLILKWNGCFGELCPIEDDGGGLEALANGLRYQSVQLSTHTYDMKHTQIPGVLGSIAFDSRLDGFHQQLATALLTFGCYSGLGIKTALGMGGLEIT